MPHPPSKEAHCDRCKVSFVIPDVPAEVWDEVMALIRSDKRLEAVKFLANKSGQGFFSPNLSNAKALVFHISRNGELCTRCFSPLAQKGEFTCPKCRSLNFNW